MTEDENNNNLERLKREFNHLAGELRVVPFSGENELRLGERELLDPTKCAVVVVDMHGAYCDPNEVLPTLMESSTDNLQSLVPKLGKFLKSARAFGVKVAWTKMKENPEDMPDNYKVKWKIDDTPPLSVPGTKGYEYSGLQSEPGDIEVEKVTYNAFKNTGLDERFKELGITTLVIVGGYTSRCVQATITVAADMLDYHVFVCRDLVGVPDTILAEELTTFNVTRDIYGFVKTPQVITDAWKSYQVT